MKPFRKWGLFAAAAVLALASSSTARACDVSSFGTVHAVPSVVYSPSVAATAVVQPLVVDPCFVAVQASPVVVHQQLVRQQVVHSSLVQQRVVQRQVISVRRAPVRSVQRTVVRSRFF